ncbi:TetR family transcriptional regulator [Saccharopolyspora erythraea]|nr:TetR family transcriptional regulator [Saccharopolyspora erythraea]
MSDQARRQQRLDISRQAVRLFGEQGVAATSGQQIARAAGVSERTLWRLFRAKESCVEPLLTKAVEGLQAILRSWPPEVDLAEHLRGEYTFMPESSRADTDAVLAVIRMTRDEPALRAAWLVLQERAEPTFAEVLSLHTGLPADAPEIRVRAATLNAALRVTADDFAWATAEGVSAEAVDRHRKRMAEALRTTASSAVHLAEL